MTRKVQKIMRVRKPLILIGCEGKNKTETLYFSNFSSKECRIKFASGNSTDPTTMLSDIIKYMQKEDISKELGDKIFLLIDTDLSEKRIKEIESLENIATKYGIEIITSSPTFEIWFLMHFKTSAIVFNSSGDVKKALKKYIKSYKENMNIYNEIVSKTYKAIENAKKQEKSFIEKSLIYHNPHSTVYKIIETINTMNKNN